MRSWGMEGLWNWALGKQGWVKNSAQMFTLNTSLWGGSGWVKSNRFSVTHWVHWHRGKNACWCSCQPDIPDSHRVRSLPGPPTFLKGQETFWFFSSFHHLKYKKVLNESSIFSKLKFFLFSGCKLWPIVLFKCWVTPFSFGYPRTARKIPVFFQKPFFVLGKGQRFFKTFQILSTPRRAGGL